MTIETNAFLKEVDEHLHYEKMKELWQKYKIAVFAGVGALFLFVGGTSYYNQAKETNLVNEATNWWYVTQATSGEKAIEEALQVVVKENSVGYRSLAKIELAKLYLSQGNSQKALAELNLIKQDKQIDTLHKDLASMFEGQILMETNPQQAKAIFTSLDNSNSPFKLTALEMLALMAEKADNKMESLAFYERIAENMEISQAMRNRAELKINKIKAE